MSSKRKKRDKEYQIRENKRKARKNKQHEYDEALQSGDIDKLMRLLKN